MIVLGIDPGTAALGYGIIDQTPTTIRAIDHGCFTTPPSDPLPVRLLAIHRHVAGLIETHRPQVVAVERLYFSGNAQTAFGVGQARGVVLLAAAERGIPVREATPSEVKNAVAGYGAAPKDQVARMVAVLLGLAHPPTPDDAADALATAICIAGLVRSGPQAASATMDRAAIAPIDDTPSSYDRAVREALRRERAAGAVPAGRIGGTPTGRPDPARVKTD